MKALIILLALLIAGCVSVTPEAHVSGTSEITGHVSGPYSLEYGITDGSYMPMHSVFSQDGNASGVLGSWNTVAMDDGKYYVKLQSNGATDYFFVEVDNLHISSPEANSTIPAEDFLVIKGSVNGNISSFSVWYRKEGGSWTNEGLRLKDGGQGPVSEATLAILNTSVLDTFGIYEIELRGGNQSERVRLKYLGADAYEPDDTINTSKVLSGLQKRTIFPSSDIDVMELPVEPGSYFIDLKHTNLHYITYELYDAESNRLYGDTRYTKNLVRIVFDVNSSGPYYLAVSSYYGEGTYTVTMDEYVDADNDGSPASVDCDDTDSSWVAPYPGLEVDSDVFFCNGTYDVGSVISVQDGASVTCDETILDGTGFYVGSGASITGCTVVDSSFGVYASRYLLLSREAITLSDMIFRNCTDALAVDFGGINVSSLSVSDSTFKNCDHASYSLNSNISLSDSTFFNSAIYNSGGLLQVDGNVFDCRDCDAIITSKSSYFPEITDNHISGGNTALHLLYSNKGTIVNNTFTNSQMSVYLFSAADNNFTDNMIFNTTYGVYIEGGSEHNIFDRFVFKNTNYTVYNNQPESVFFKDTEWGVEEVQKHVYDHHDDETLGYVNMSVVCSENLTLNLTEDFSLCEGDYYPSSDIMFAADDISLDCHGSSIHGRIVIDERKGITLKRCNASVVVRDSENLRLMSNVLPVFNASYLMHSELKGNTFGTSRLRDCFNNSFRVNEFAGVLLNDSYSNTFYDNTFAESGVRDIDGYANRYISNDFSSGFIFSGTTMAAIPINDLEVALQFFGTERFVVRDNQISAETGIDVHHVSSTASVSKIIQNNTFKTQIAIMNRAPIPLLAPGNYFGTSNVEDVLIDDTDNSSYGPILYGDTQTVNLTEACVDSDGENYYTRGRLTFEMNEYYDSCIDNGTLREQFCVSDSVKGTVEHECPCADGACLMKCFDSDGGMDFYTAGYVEGLYEGKPDEQEDRCYNGTVLAERICSPNGDSTIKTVKTKCQDGCVDGACVNVSGPVMMWEDTWEAGDMAYAIDSTQEHVYVSGQHDFHTVVYDRMNGRVVWNSTYPGNWVGDLAVSDGVYLTGMNEDEKFYTLKAESNTGDQIWSRELGDGEGTGLAVSNGTIYVSGYDGSGQFYIASYHANGSLRWSKKESNGQAGARVAANGAEVYVGGRTQSYDMYLIKYDALGEKLWEIEDEQYGIIRDMDYSDGLYVTGGSFYVSKYSPSGDLQWVNAEIAGSASTLAVCDGVYVGGVPYSEEGYLIVKYDDEGEIAWNITNELGRYPLGITCNGGYFYVTGYDDNDDYYTAAYKDLAHHCFDGIKNQDERDIDCGGSCSPCGNCSDGIQNQGEEGVDCGGPCAPCEATCSDGIQNQGEEGVDCGGPCFPCVTAKVFDQEGSGIVSVPLVIDARVPVSQITVNLSYDPMLELINVTRNLPHVYSHEPGLYQGRVHLNESYSGVLVELVFNVTECSSTQLHLGGSAQGYEVATSSGSFSCIGGVDAQGVDTLGKTDGDSELAAGKSRPKGQAETSFSYTPYVSLFVLFLIGVVVFAVVFGGNTVNRELENYLQENHLKGYEMTVLKEQARQQGWDHALVERTGSNVLERNTKYLHEYIDSLYAKGLSPEQVREMLRKFPQDLLGRLK
ncbi:MAG: NosD domain-containing protein [Nanobdellota archaeon]